MNIASRQYLTVLLFLGFLTMLFLVDFVSRQGVSFGRAVRI